MENRRHEESIVSENDLRYARHVALKVKPDQIGNFLTRMREGVFPRLREQAGIRRMYLLSSTGGNEFLSVTFWNNKANADAYGDSIVFARVNELVRDLLESDPVMIEYDIEFHDVNAKDLPPPQSAVVPQKKAPRSERKSAKKKTQ